MKELSIDEKAEAYDKALERVKDFIEKQNPPAFDKNLIGTIFPELKESEDERISKEIIKYLERTVPHHHRDEVLKSKEWTAWLEKQGEQKPTIEMKSAEESLGIDSETYNKIVDECIYGEQKHDDKVKSKFKVGDWVTNGLCAWRIDSIDEDMYYTNHCGIDCGGDIESIDKEYHLWTIQDAEDGDVLRIRNLTFIFQEITNNNVCHKNAVVAYCSYEDNDDGFGVCGPDCITDLEIIIPATKEQRDLLSQKMKEAGYEWDAEKKELRKIELTDVDHEYYSELLKNDKSDNIADYAYQCVYCMSHDWAIENPTWDNVQSACRLGAKWQKKHDVSEEWNKEDEKMISRLRDIVEKYAFSHSAVDVNGDLCEKEYIEADNWLKSLKQRIGWKPSDEQITVLELASKYERVFTPKQIDILIGLKEQLKKLTE